MNPSWSPSPVTSSPLLPAQTPHTYFGHKNGTRTVKVNTPWHWLASEKYLEAKSWGRWRRNPVCWGLGEQSELLWRNRQATPQSLQLDDKKENKSQTLGALYSPSSDGLWHNCMVWVLLFPLLRWGKLRSVSMKQPTQDRVMLADCLGGFRTK